MADVQIVIHRLASGASVLVTSPGHGFRFSDGTSCGPQDRAVCDRLTLHREFREVCRIKGMPLNQVRMYLDEGQLAFLHELTAMADLILVSFPVLQALRDQGVRDRFPNVVAFNATPETQRSAVQDKVIDINNWSY